MKRTISLLAILLVGLIAQAQTKSVSILGDSYSTFEGAIPQGNAIWYFKKNNPKQTDVNRVEQTWWDLLIKRKGWKLEMNNSYSGATICNTGYRKRVAWKIGDCLEIERYSLFERGCCGGVIEINHFVRRKKL